MSMRALAALANALLLLNALLSPIAHAETVSPATSTVQAEVDAPPPGDGTDGTGATDPLRPTPPVRVYGLPGIIRGIERSSLRKDLRRSRYGNTGNDKHNQQSGTGARRHPGAAAYDAIRRLPCAHPISRRKFQSKNRKAPFTIQYITRSTDKPPAVGLS